MCVCATYSGLSLRELGLGGGAADASEPLHDAFSTGLQIAYLAPYASSHAAATASISGGTSEVYPSDVALKSKLAALYASLWPSLVSSGHAGPGMPATVRGSGPLDADDLLVRAHLVQLSANPADSPHFSSSTAGGVGDNTGVRWLPLCVGVASRFLHGAHPAGLLLRGVAERLRGEIPPATAAAALAAAAARSDAGGDDASGWGFTLDEVSSGRVRFSLRLVVFFVLPPEPDETSRAIERAADKVRP